MIPLHSWSVPGRYPGNVRYRDHGNVEGIAETDEFCCFIRGIDIETSGKPGRLVGDETNRMTAHAAESHEHIPGEVHMGFHKIAIVAQCSDQYLHVVIFICGIGYKRVQAVIKPVRIISPIDIGRHREDLPYYSGAEN